MARMSQYHDNYINGKENPQVVVMIFFLLNCDNIVNGTLYIWTHVICTYKCYHQVGGKDTGANSIFHANFIAFAILFWNGSL